MNWAKKLFKKIWFSIEDEGRKDHIYVDDLVLAVLEKNKEIGKNVRKLPDIVKHKNSYFLATTLAEARAFRELVSAVEKVKQK